MISCCDNVSPVQELMKDEDAVKVVGERSGVMLVRPSGYTIRTCSILFSCRMKSKISQVSLHK